MEVVQERYREKGTGLHLGPSRFCKRAVPLLGRPQRREPWRATKARLPPRRTAWATPVSHAVALESESSTCHARVGGGVVSRPKGGLGRAARTELTACLSSGQGAALPDDCGMWIGEWTHSTGGNPRTGIRGFSSRDGEPWTLNLEPRRQTVRPGPTPATARRGGR